MTENQFRDLEIAITRYRYLEREVTDPLAACLLHGIVVELEADLKKGADSANLEIAILSAAATRES